LQRLFSMFPNGWPGRALLLLRLAAAAILIRDGVANLVGQSRWDLIALQSVAIVAGLFLLVGLWTPVVGVIVALLGVGAVISGTPYVRGAILLAVVGLALAMLGPGVTSIDARLFGRKRIDIP
jgi:putative oxidoreductase